MNHVHRNLAEETVCSVCKQERQEIRAAEESAEELESLRAQVAALEADRLEIAGKASAMVVRAMAAEDALEQVIPALRPFAEYASALDGRFGRETVVPAGAMIGDAGPTVSVMNFRAAHALVHGYNATEAAVAALSAHSQKDFSGEDSR